MTLIRRGLAIILAVVMVITMAPFAWADDSAAAPKTVTVNELLVETYKDSLTDAEKALLTSGLISSEKKTFTPPTDSDAAVLLEVDPEAGTLTAKDYHSGGYTWKAKKAQLAEQSIALTENEFHNAKNGSFSYAANSFDIDVTYTMEIFPLESETESWKEAQQRLLSAAENLKNAAGLVRKVKECADRLHEVLQTPIHFDLNDFAQSVVLGTEQTTTLNGFLLAYCGTGIPRSSASKDILMRYEGDSNPNRNEEIRNRVKALAEDEKSDGLNLCSMAGIYVTEDGVKNVADLCAKANTLNRTIADTCQRANEALVVIASIRDIAVVTGKLHNELVDIYTSLGELCGILKAAHLDENGAGDPVWASISNLVKPNLPTEDTERLSAMVNGWTDTDLSHTQVSETAKLLADTTTLTKEIRRSGIEVSVCASVYNNPESNQPTEKKETKKVLCPVDKSMEEIMTMIEEMESAALARINSADSADPITEDHFVRSVDVNTLPAGGAFSADELYQYTIRYTPRNYPVNYTYTEREDLPFGSFIRLPSHPELAKAWDYTVTTNDGVKYFNQGDVIRVLSDMSISRSEGDAWQLFPHRELILNAYMKDDAAGSSILLQSALNIEGTERLRVPTSDRGLISINGSTVTASPYKANHDGAQWIPTRLLSTCVDDRTESGSLKKQQDGTYTATLPEDAMSIQTEYSISLPWAQLQLDKATAKELCNLPKKLADEADLQLDVIQDILGYKSKIELLNAVAEELRNIRSLCGPVSKDADNAAKDLYNRCYNESTKHFDIYDLITDYENLGGMAAKLAFYYSSYDFINAQFDIVNSDLDIMLSDSNIRDTLTSYGVDIEDMLGELNSICTKLKKYPPDGHINAVYCAPGALNSLTTAIVENKNSVRSYSRLDEPTLTESIMLPTPGNKLVKLIVQLHDSKGNDIKPAVTKYTVFHAPAGADSVVLDFAQQQTVFGLLQEAVDEAEIDSEHYSLHPGFAWVPAAGDVLTEDTTESYLVFEPNIYHVEVIDESDTEAEEYIFPYDRPTVWLPQPPQTAGFRYKYVIDGENIAGDEYTFSAEQIDRLFTERTCTISRTRTDRAITVTDAKGNVIIGSESFAEALANAKSGSTIELKEPVTMTADVVLYAAVKIVGASKLLMSGNQIIMSDNNASIVADSDKLAVKSAVKNYTVSVSTKDGISTYTLKYNSPAVQRFFGVAAVEKSSVKSVFFNGSRLYLDVSPMGITEKQLLASINIHGSGHSDAKITATLAKLESKDGIIPTGTEITFAQGEVKETYTLVIQSDTNNNGKLDSGDGIKIRRHYLGIEMLSGSDLLAADLNGNGYVDSGDAAKSRAKYLAGTASYGTEDGAEKKTDKK